MAAYLRVVGVPPPTNLQFDRYELSKERVVIGRGDGADLQLCQDQVSRLHVVLELLGGLWLATDHSANGTLLNDVPMLRTEPLRRGSVLRVGGYKLILDGDVEPPGTLATQRPLRRLTAAVLTPREREAVALLCLPLIEHPAGPFVQPATVAQIESRMHCSKTRVEQLLKAAQRKILEVDGLLDRSELANAALVSGVVQESELRHLAAKRAPNPSTVTSATGQPVAPQIDRRGQ